LTAKDKIIAALKKSLTETATALKNAVKAMGMLTYGKTDDYKIVPLTEKQSRLIDSVRNYARNCLESLKKPEMAEEISNQVGISESIAAEIGKLTPPEQLQSYSRGRR
jgi:hypothetical protein